MLALMLPTGHGLREMVASYHSASEPDRLSPSLWDLADAEFSAHPQTRSGELLVEIRRLAKRAQEGEAQAATELALIALQATLHLKRLSVDNSTIARMAPHMPLWPIIWSPIASMKTTEDQITKLNLGADFVVARGTETRHKIKTRTGFKWGKTKGQRGARPGITSKATFYAAAVACYMFGIRTGVSSSPCAKWANNVRRLPPFSEETVNLWWPLAREEINRAYPDIEVVICGHLTSAQRQGKQQAMRLIREAFQTIWKVFG